VNHIKGSIIIFILPSFRQCVEPESGDGALKSLDSGLRTSGMTDRKHDLLILF
jgi:hypothetical protein